jgi:hypothetical protein
MEGPPARRAGLLAPALVHGAARVGGVTPGLCGLGHRPVGYPVAARVNVRTASAPSATANVSTTARLSTA